MKAGSHLSPAFWKLWAEKTLNGRKREMASWGRGGNSGVACGAAEMGGDDSLWAHLRGVRVENRRSRGNWDSSQKHSPCQADHLSSSYLHWVTSQGGTLIAHQGSLGGADLEEFLFSICFCGCKKWGVIGRSKRNIKAVRRHFHFSESDWWRSKASITRSAVKAVALTRYAGRR